MSTRSLVSGREGTLKHSGDLHFWVLLNWTACWKQILDQLRLWPERKAPKPLPGRCVTTLCVLQTMMQQMTICSNSCRQVFLITVGQVIKHQTTRSRSVRGFNFILLINKSFTQEIMGVQTPTSNVAAQTLPHIQKDWTYFFKNLVNLKRRVSFKQCLILIPDYWQI